jgi:hypothetical protein
MDAIRRAEALVAEAQAIFARAEDADREITDAEAGAIRGKLARVERLKSQAHSERMGQRIGGADLTQPQGPGGFGGWSGLTSGIDLRAGRTKSVARLESIMRRKDLSGGTDVDGYKPAQGVMVQTGFDNRYVYPLFQRAPLTDENLSVADWRQTGSRTVTGDVERDPFSTSEKATLDVSVEYTSEDVRQVAVVIDEVPNAIVDGNQTLMQFLRSEGQLQLDIAIDSHVLSQIDAAAPPSGQDGADLIAQTRNAISAMRLVGANPTTMILSPDDAAALDLDTRGADDMYTFAVRDVGSSSPLWTLRVVESASIVTPMLVDPTRLGVLYAGSVTLLTDPYSGFTKNTTDIRIEGNVLFHIRDINGAYEITAGS